MKPELQGGPAAPSSGDFASPSRGRTGFYSAGEGIPPALKPPRPAGAPVDAGNNSRIASRTLAGKTHSARRAGGERRTIKALVACEYSGRVRTALRLRGIDAISVDLLPSEDDSPHHVQGDVLPFLAEPWDLVIAHPPCTYLANSGVRWRVERQEWDKVREGAEFFLACLNANAPLVAVENPVMHKYAREIVGRKADFTVQPWQFGDPAKKRTCFWTRGLFPLRSTSDMTAADARADCHLAPPSPDRWKERSRTYQGIANAIASQWGDFAASALPATPSAFGPGAFEGIK